MKIIIYSSIFFPILLLHTGLILFQYVPVIPTITASLGLIILSLLFYEIYKKYKYANFAKYLLVIFVVIWGLLVFSQIEYIPAKKVTVTDVFGNPLENISIGVQDYVGETFNPAGGNAEYRFPRVFYYTTDKNGQVTIKPRFYFGERKAVFIHIPVNDYVFGGPDVINKINEAFDSKTLQLYKDKNYQVALAPIKEDYRKCDLITDKDRKNECLVYTLFYSAVKEKNPELCKLYGDEGVKTALYRSRFFREDELKNECLMLVGGIMNNNSGICSEIQNNDSRYFNDQCKCLFDSLYCEDYYKNEFDSQKSLYLSDVHNYLCEIQLYISQGDIRYKNYLRYLDTASDLYRRMFCN